MTANPPTQQVIETFFAESSPWTFGTKRPSDCESLRWDSDSSDLHQKIDLEISR